MLRNKIYIAISCLVLNATNIAAQTLSLDSVLSNIKTNNPQLKMYDAEIQSMDAAALGARSWMPPQVATGFFMTPYNTNLWKATEMNQGMGSYMFGVTQMIPNASKLKADFNLMAAMSSVEKENKNYTINQLKALAKTSYFQWLILKKKIGIAKENLLLLDYMIKSVEIRYQFNMDKLPTYYKAKSQYSSLESMIIMLENDISQNRIILNTLMAQDKSTIFEIEDKFVLKEFNSSILDTALLSKDRSDVKAIEKTIELNQLKIVAEKSKLLPEFGVRYDQMFAFGSQPQLFSLMGMVNVPVPWSVRMYRANINSFKIKNESLNWQRQMILNEATGTIAGMINELNTKKKQYDIVQNSVIPALKRNYDTALLNWENNTGDLFPTLDAWEALNMAQLDALDKLHSILMAQVEIEKQLETN